MFERFTRSARATVQRARDVAATEGSATVEAQHLLLALTQRADDPTSRALATLGISERAVRGALEEEFTHALQAVGVAATTPRPGPPRPGRAGGPTPRWGQSAKLVLVRALRVAIDRGHKRIEDRHLLIALSLAEAGVIPRVLRTLGVAPTDIDIALR
jgi:ATP-dependent Clp protease ATP-binding subunit ClpA